MQIIFEQNTKNGSKYNFSKIQKELGQGEFEPTENGQKH
jgi:hypothetical protein